MRIGFALYERPEGVAVADASRIVYDVEQNVAQRGPARVDGPAVVWALGEGAELLVTDRYKESSTPSSAALAVEVELDPEAEWVVRCDRVDFPPGGVAYRHDHPGAGIRRLLVGELTLESGEGTETYRAGDAWFEAAGYPVVATASATEDTAFVRVLVLPAAWAGRRTIRYLDSADDERPKLQRAEILLEEPLRL